jgi:hypothetical protein
MALMLTRWACRRLRAQLVDAAAGRLDGAGRARVASHVARCGACAAALAALRDVPQALRAAPPLDDEFWRAQRAAVMRAVRDLPLPGAADRARTASVAGWRAWAPVLVAAAAVVAAVAMRVPAPSLRSPASADAIDTLDDPTLLSLSDLAGVSAPGIDHGQVVRDVAPLPELSNEELDALAQLVGARER